MIKEFNIKSKSYSLLLSVSLLFFSQLTYASSPHHVYVLVANCGDSVDGDNFPSNASPTVTVTNVKSSGIGVEIKKTELQSVKVAHDDKHPCTANTVFKIRDASGGHLNKNSSGTLTFQIKGFSPETERNMKTGAVKYTPLVCNYKVTIQNGKLDHGGTTAAVDSSSFPADYCKRLSDGSGDDGDDIHVRFRYSTKLTEYDHGNPVSYIE